MPVYAILARNVGNLGGVSGVRLPMPIWVAKMSESPALKHMGARVTSFYRHTGNFVLNAPIAELSVAHRVISSVLDRDCAAISIVELEALATKVSPEPSASSTAVRWTPGIALLAVGPADVRGVCSYEHARLTVLSPTTVAVQKRDALAPGQILDRERRFGGWGAIASKIESQAGGLWTARSLSTIRGLLRRAEKLAS
jgi:hypothetical protein